VVDAVDKQREPEDIGQEDELLQRNIGLLATVVSGGYLVFPSPALQEEGLTYMADVAADLSTGNEEPQRCHPFVGANTRLSREVVEVCHEARHQILQPWIGALCIDPVRIGRDVINCEVEERRADCYVRHSHGVLAQYKEKDRREDIGKDGVRQLW
jgi:hypothetical protein